MRRMLVFLILIGVLSACSGTTQPPQSGRLLVWNQDTKQVLWLENGKSGVAIAEKVERASICTSNTKQAVFYSGTASEGVFFLLDLGGNIAQPIKLAIGAPMGCEVSGRATFSADGRTLALLVYPAGAGLGAEYATGVLRVFDAASNKVLKEFPDTLSYSWFENTLNMVVVRADAGSIASASVITWQVGTDQQSTAAIPSTASGCTMVNVQAARFQQSLYVALGERCASNTTYFSTLYQLTPEKAIVLSDRKPAGGKFYPDTNTHTLLALSDGKTLVWIIPDGRSIETGTLWRWDASNKRGESLALFIVTDQSPAPLLGRRYAPDPSGEQLAYIQRNPQGGETLWAWELNHPDNEPAQINDMIRSDKIAALAWSANGTRLSYLFLAADSYLSYIDKRGARRDAVHGIFQSLVLDATGDYAYTVQQDGSAYNLVQFRLKDSAPTILIKGATLPPVPLLAR